ncbi:amino acid ABC transporter permease [Nitratireductor indicus]|uniref:Glutamate/aspartate import permease protein GltK n=1 Tax=Nitratireductor indicus C115 TaxID=1231190 RepID=K2NXJ7_9HYPH|nr:amino acid ABC transporter permease [Nitratireductor indicus]EKF42599.1 ABC transporter membrane spanning protein [Nitratireductor indicus C115]MDS1138088.1 amino acid ABC transporter permease [Nitratireductor indicus]SFQ57756.1 polar amino acid transport system permease protein [Nitratireductor indicus]
MSLELVFQYLVSPTFIHGAIMTLLITVSSLVFGLLAGFLLALLNQVKFPPVKWLTVFYLWLFRGTPVLFQIIFIYNVLPTFGIRLSAFASGVIALSLNEGAYMAEIIRSGLQAIKSGQRTAGMALGMTRTMVLRHVVMPQAARIMLPPIGNQTIGMLKTSALVSVIAVEELLLVANQTASATFRYFEALSAAGIYYLALTTIFMAGQYWMERALEPKRSRVEKRSLLSALLQPAEDKH